MKPDQKLLLYSIYSILKLSFIKIRIKKNIDLTDVISNKNADVYNTMNDLFRKMISII